MRPLAPFVLAAICMSGCSSTAPSCTDRYGRGSDQPTELRVSCAAVGADLQCSAVATNTGELYVYCPVMLTVTGQTSWSSSDPAAGAFTGSPPGFLKVLAPGRVHVDSKYGFLQGTTIPFAVDPRGTPERLIQVAVTVEDSRTAARVPDVSVDIVPERGPAQV